MVVLGGGAVSLERGTPVLGGGAVSFERGTPVRSCLTIRAGVSNEETQMIEVYDNQVCAVLKF